MAYKLNQKIKTHIADMATRNKHKAAFDKAFAAFKEDAYQQSRRPSKTRKMQPLKLNARSRKLSQTNSGKHRKPLTA